MFPLEQFPEDATVYTQRKIFSLVSSIFDLLGLLSPLTIRIKMVLQQIWKIGGKWDDFIPQELHNALQKVLSSYFAMPEIRTPRTVHNFSKTTSSQQHIFVDASKAAMTAVAYLRTTLSQTSPPQACFLMGKCKVAPIKQISAPKMVLEAVVIEVCLLQLIEGEMTLTFTQIFHWSDSQVVLDWITSKKRRNVFVSNRLQEIQKVSSPKQRHHIATCLNPADHGTRGLETKDIQRNSFFSAIMSCCGLRWTNHEQHVLTRQESPRHLSSIRKNFSLGTKFFWQLQHFSILFIAQRKCERTQYTFNEDIQSSRNYLLK